VADDSNERETEPIIQEASSSIRRITDPIGQGLLKRFSGAGVYDPTEPSRVEAAEEDFLNAFARRSWWYSISTTVLLLILIVVECTVLSSLPKQSYGLILDLIGAIILGRGLLLSPDAIVEKATAPFGGRMSGFRAAQAEDAADGVWGVSLLVLGVLLQGLAVTNIWIRWVPC